MILIVSKLYCVWDVHYVDRSRFFCILNLQTWSIQFIAFAWTTFIMQN